MFLLELVCTMHTAHIPSECNKSNCTDPLKLLNGQKLKWIMLTLAIFLSILFFSLLFAITRVNVRTLTVSTQNTSNGIFDKVKNMYAERVFDDYKWVKCGEKINFSSRNVKSKQFDHESKRISITMDIVYGNAVDNYRLLGIRSAHWLTCIYDAFVFAFIRRCMIRRVCLWAFRRLLFWFFFSSRSLPQSMDFGTTKAPSGKIASQSGKGDKDAGNERARAWERLYIK